MRILILNEFFYPDMLGGTGMVLSQVARRLRDEHSFDIDVFTTKNSYRGGSESTPRFSNWDGIRIHRIGAIPFDRASMPIRILSNLLTSIRAAFFAISRRYDAVLVSTAPPFLPLAALWAKRLRGTPYAYVIYDLEPDRAIAMKVFGAESLPARIQRRMQAKWLGGASRVIAIGRCMKEYIVGRYPVDGARVAVIAVGADGAEVLPGSKSTRFREEQNLSGFVALYSGNFGRYHDFDAMLDAAAAMQAAGDAVTFVLVGNGVKESQIRDRVDREGLANTRVLPFVLHEDFSDLLASADVSLVTLEDGMAGLCVPSKFYSILASGRPTVAMLPETTETARVVLEERCGYVVPPGDAHSLVEILRKAMSEPNELEEMGRRGREALEGKYDLNAIAAQFADVLSATAGATSRKRADGAVERSHAADGSQGGR